MLRAVTFKNFLCFKDHQSLEFQNGSNIIVGANATGKSTIFELTRRCLSKTASATDSSVNDTSRDAFVISKFEITRGLSDKVPEGYYLYSLYVRRSKDKNNDRYKLVCITNKEETCPKYCLDCYGGIEVTLKKRDKINVLEEMKNLTKGNDVDKHFKNIDDNVLIKRDAVNNMEPEGSMGEPDHKEAVSDFDCEAILQKLHDVVVVIFPIRSPGPLQWSHSKNIEKGNENNVIASKHAEILQQLMGSEDVDKDRSEIIFKTIIHPLDYTFTKGQDSIITVDDGNRNISLLEVPEGIIEAKQFSLMFAHKKYQTLMLEEPDRAMHPQMIQKLRDFLIRKCEDQKTVIFISHHAEMINQWTMPRLHICRRKRDHDGNFKHFICSWGKDVKNTHQQQDQLKQMLYSGDVLFVEGITDKSVIGWVFDRVLDVKHLNGIEDSDLPTLKKKIAGIQIISMEGGKGYRHMREAAKHLDLPFLFLLDADIVFSYNMDKDGLKNTIKNVLESLKTTKSTDEEKKAASNMKSLKLLSPFVLQKQNIFELPSEIKETKDAEVIRDHLRKKKNVFLWDSRNLEVMILKTIFDIRMQSTATTSDQYQGNTYTEMIDCLKEKKTGILEMEMGTTKTLVEYLLEGEEMKAFLKFLLKRIR